MEELPAARWQRWWRELPRDDEAMIVAARQGFVLRRDQLAPCGVSRSHARTAVRRGRWLAPAHGVVAPIQVDDGMSTPWQVARRQHTLLATAAALRRPDHAISGNSAATIHGVPTMRIPDSAELTAPDECGLGLQSPGHSFGAFLPACDMSAWHGALVTTAGRTVIDQARHSRRDGVLAADAALREGLTTPDELAAILDGARGWPGVRQARTIVAFADARAESPLESITRLALHDDGFPPPELQMSVGAYRVDFCWPSQRLILEADGREKYVGDALWEEKLRERYLRRLGFEVERVVWADITREWALTRLRLRSYFRAV